MSSSSRPHHKKPKARKRKAKASSNTPPLVFSRQALIDYIAHHQSAPDVNELADIFALKNEGRRALRAMLRELVDEGILIKQGKAYRQPKALPSVTVLEVTGMSDDGEPIAEPVEERLHADMPIIVQQSRRSPAVALGDRILARLTRHVEEECYLARIMKVLPKEQRRQSLGLIQKEGKHWWVEPVRRKDDAYEVAEDALNGAQHGELVRIEKLPGNRRDTLGRPRARVVERLGQADGPKAASMIAVHSHDIPYVFSPEAMALAEAAPSPTLTKSREDLRDYPLVTIDGEDARDFDDALWAEPDTSPDNQGGWHLLVAIADVAHYVRSGDALDVEAQDRGNSTYFPDRVVPMLPEGLSNGLCSLRPDEDRYCMAMHIWIDQKGNILSYRLVRGLMRSRARLTYTQVQQAMNGSPDAAITPLMEEIIRPLYKAYASLKHEREQRGALALDLSEYFIQIEDDGTVSDIHPKKRLDSHQLVEECMIAANVCAAMLLFKQRTPALFRTHEQPDAGKVKDFIRFLESMGYSMFKGDGLQPRHFNRLFSQIEQSPAAPIIHQSALRTQSQAFYGTQRIGHFGLALQHYTHFTSPIRRYSDLIVHRALIRACRLGDDGLSEDEIARLDAIGEHISMTERRSMAAEYEARDRYIVQFHAHHLGEVRHGRIVGMAQRGMFVVLDDTGADGMLPFSALNDDHYTYDPKHQIAQGRRTGRRFHLGDRLQVRITDANPLTGSLRYELDQMLESPVGSQAVSTEPPHRKKRGKSSSKKTGRRKLTSANSTGKGKRRKPRKKT